MPRKIYDPNESPEESRRKSDEFIAMLDRWATEPEFDCDMSVIEAELDGDGLQLREPEILKTRVKQHVPVA